MEVKGDLLTDKDNAGAAILEAFKDAKGLEPVPIGSYRGFAMSLTVEDFGRDFILTLKGKMNHRVTLGKDARGKSFKFCIRTDIKLRKLIPGAIYIRKCCTIANIKFHYSVVGIIIRIT